MDYLEDVQEIGKLMNEYINNKRVDGIIILSTFSIGEANVVRLMDSEIPLSFWATNPPYSLPTRFCLTTTAP